LANSADFARWAIVPRSMTSVIGQLERDAGVLLDEDGRHAARFFRDRTSSSTMIGASLERLVERSSIGLVISARATASICCSRPN
jgi:hypothetical protein